MPLSSDTRIIELIFQIDAQHQYPYCQRHSSGINPYGLGMIPASSCEKDAKLFLFPNRYIIQYQVQSIESTIVLIILLDPDTNSTDTFVHYFGAPMPSRMLRQSRIRDYRYAKNYRQVKLIRFCSHKFEQTFTNIV